MCRILLAEDSKGDYGDIIEWLDAAGLKVTHARSQEDAREVMRREPVFDLYIIDIMLRRTNNEPPDTDTLGGFRVISQIPNDCNVIALTKRGDREIVEEKHGAKHPNIVEYSYKPLPREKWVARVMRLVKGDE